MSISEMTKNLQFTSKAVAVAIISSDNKSFKVNGEVEYNVKGHFGNQANILWLIKATKCALGLEVSQTLKEPVQC